MVDQAVSTLEQYALEIKNVRKGRGFWIIEAKEGDFVLKEYNGNEERATLQKQLTDQIRLDTGILTQEIIPNREGSLLTRDSEERNYTLQSYFEGRECNLKEARECILAVQTMARMHKGMYLQKETLQQDMKPYSLQKEFGKRNQELRRIRRYLKEKRKKNDFERFLYDHFNLYFEKALEVEESWKYYAPLYERPEPGVWFCHGDFQHHNVWLHYQDVMILQFEKYMPDLPCRDVYLFLRKLMEKNNWDAEMGKNVLEVYGKERPISILERICLQYRFMYPEKFWKIANYYFNSKKSFMPEKNMEKLKKLLELEQKKEKFIELTLRDLDKKVL